MLADGLDYDIDVAPAAGPSLEEARVLVRVPRSGFAAVRIDQVVNPGNAAFELGTCNERSDELEYCSQFVSSSLRPSRPSHLS